MKELLRILCALVCASCLLPSLASAGLIGETLRFQCPECGPPYDQTFVVLAGLPELTPFDAFIVDVEADTYRIEWMYTESSIIDPGHFILSQLPVGSVGTPLLDPSSTYIPVGISYTATSVTIDISGRSVVAGQFALIHLANNEIPEPATWGLMLLGLAALSWRLKRT